MVFKPVHCFRNATQRDRSRSRAHHADASFFTSAIAFSDCAATNLLCGEICRFVIGKTFRDGLQQPGLIVLHLQNIVRVTVDDLRRGFLLAMHRIGRNNRTFQIQN